MTIHIPQTSKAELLNSTSQAAILVWEVMQKIQGLNIPMTHKLSDEQLGAIAAANNNEAPVAMAA